MSTGALHRLAPEAVTLICDGAVIACDAPSNGRLAQCWVLYGRWDDLDSVHGRLEAPAGSRVLAIFMAKRLAPRERFSHSRGAGPLWRRCAHAAVPS